MIDELRGWLVAHPGVTAFWAACIVFGVITGGVMLRDNYGLPASLFAGFLGGAGTALILSANRMID